jgi:DNA-binding beta-propeller fold protein YncE
LVVAACGSAEVETKAPPGGGYKLYTATSTQTSQTVSVIDTHSHAVERSLPLGTPSPDWKHLYSVRGTALVDLDPQTGAVRHTLALRGAFQLPAATISGLPGGLSQDGRWLVLQAFDGPVDATPTASHLLLVDTSDISAAKQFDLKGYFQFDAVSNDGQRVYLIEYLSSSIYQVRDLNTVSRQLDPTVIVDKTDGGAAMTGLRLSGVPSRDGQWLYSVYIREHQGAFIHALNLQGNIAICIDLPGAGYASSEGGFHWSLALTPDGSHLYAANGAMGVVADLDTRNGAPTLTRTSHYATSSPSASLVQVVEAKGFGANGTAVTPDGKTLVTLGVHGVTWIDTATLQATDSQLIDWTLWSIALSPTGDNLYAVSDGGMIAEISMTGRHAATTFSGGPGQPMAVLRVQAAQGS